MWPTLNRLIVVAVSLAIVWYAVAYLPLNFGVEDSAAPVSNLATNDHNDQKSSPVADSTPAKAPAAVASPKPVAPSISFHSKTLPNGKFAIDELTVNGKTYKNFSVIQKSDNSVTFIYFTGGSQIYYNEMAEADQAKFQQLSLNLTYSDIRDIEKKTW